MTQAVVIEALLKEFGVGTTLASLSEADSFTILTFVMELEKRAGVQVPPTELVPANFASVETILGVLSRCAPA